MSWHQWSNPNREHKRCDTLRSRSDAIDNGPFSPAIPFDSLPPLFAYKANTMT